MLSDTIRILNFDGAVLKQKNLLEQFNPRIIDLKGIGSDSRFWLSKRTSEEIKKTLTPELNNAITLLGSGDFHHISSLLVDQFHQPITVVAFDFHPDWDIFPPKLGCGSWVSSVLKKPNVSKVILLGVSSNDISNFWIQTGNLKSLKDNRVEIYPYSHEPTLTVFKKVPDNASIRIERGVFYNKIHWQELKNCNLNDLFFELAKRIRDKDVYVSIDKDCLNQDYALTNWESGRLNLDELLSLLKLIKENLNIIGLDIVGDYSLPDAKSRFKAVISRLDHPKDYSAKAKNEDAVTSINEQTNIKIIKSLIR